MIGVGYVVVRPQWWAYVGAAVIVYYGRQVRSCMLEEQEMEIMSACHVVEGREFGGQSSIKIQRGKSDALWHGDCDSRRRYTGTVGKRRVGAFHEVAGGPSHDTLPRT